MSKTLSAAAWKACLLLATGLASATVAASVRSFVVPEGPAISEESAVSEEPAVTVSKKHAVSISNGPLWHGRTGSGSLPVAVSLRSSPMLRRRGPAPGVWCSKPKLWRLAITRVLS